MRIKRWAFALAMCGTLLVAACGGADSGPSAGDTGGGGSGPVAGDTGGGGGGVVVPPLALLAGNASSASSMSAPVATAVDAAGNVYVADRINNRIRKITAAGVVTTLAGSGTQGFADGTGVAASFNNPLGVAVDAAGNVYVADEINHRIRKITADGVVTTLAGSGTRGFADGTGAAASFNNPNSVAVDASGQVYVADGSNHRIRKITPEGVVTTLAGSNRGGFADGTGSTASFFGPRGVAVDASGQVLYVADTNNHRIRKITAAGVVTTLAGGTRGFADGTGAAASFSNPIGVAVDAAGNVYVADDFNNRIRKITDAGVVTTLAGSALSGSADGTGSTASFNRPSGVAVDATGHVYVADANNRLVRKITADGVVTTLAGSVAVGFADGTGAAASFNNPLGVAVDASGQMYVADTLNHRIRKITAAGVVTTLAGSVAVGFADGTGEAASFDNPSGVAVDAAGNVYVADTRNNRIRKITADGVVTTLAGSDTCDWVDGTGAAASFCGPAGVAVDASGTVYVADRDNCVIRKVTTAGVVTTLAGVNDCDLFGSPTGVAVDASGQVYVADQLNNRIHKITAAGVVTTLAGSGTTGFADGTGAAASFGSELSGIVVDASGHVYVADTSNQVVRKITPAGVVTTLAGQAGQVGFAPGELPGLIYRPVGLAVSGADLYFTLGETGIVKLANGAQP